MYFTMAFGSGQEHIPPATLVEFGALVPARYICADAGLRHLIQLSVLVRRFSNPLQMLQLFTNSLLNDQLFNLVINVAITMQLGYNMEVGAKWGTAVMGTVVCLAGLPSSFIAVRVLPEIVVRCCHVRVLP